VLQEDVVAMIETLDRGALRGLCDRAMLLDGFAGGLRRSELVALDVGRDQTDDSHGWVEILDQGMIVSSRGKTGWREVEIGRGSSDAT
jgi:integrase